LKLYFDSQCALCRSFAKLLQKHLGSRAEVIPFSQGEQAKDFKLELSNGEFLYGNEAIYALEKEIPKVKDFFWMLPDSYKGKAVYKTYAFGKFLRKVFYFFRGRRCGEC
jgi:predicted DCC family thiol-disulfide oxidoreductase YuxK